MRPRRIARGRRKAALLWEVQRYRLDRIAKGEMEPWFAREHYFLWTLEHRGRANYADFILPGLLFMADKELLGLGPKPPPDDPADAAAS